MTTLQSYVATEEPAISTVEDGVSEGDLKAVFRVAQVTEDMTQNLWPSHGPYNCGSQKVHVALYKMKDQPVVIQKGTPVGCMVATNIIPEKVLLPGTLEALN